MNVVLVVDLASQVQPRSEQNGGEQNKCDDAPKELAAEGDGWNKCGVGICNVHHLNIAGLGETHRRSNHLNLQQRYP